MQTAEAKLANQRTQINKLFGNRFFQERQLLEYKGIIQGSYVNIDMTNIRTRKYKGVDELLVIAIIPKNQTIIGMTGSMSLLEVPLSVIIKPESENH